MPKTTVPPGGDSRAAEHPTPTRVAFLIDVHRGLVTHQCAEYWRDERRVNDLAATAIRAGWVALGREIQPSCYRLALTETGAAVVREHAEKTGLLTATEAAQVRAPEPVEIPAPAEPVDHPHPDTDLGQTITRLRRLADQLADAGLPADTDLRISIGPGYTSVQVTKDNPAPARPGLVDRLAARLNLPKPEHNDKISQYGVWQWIGTESTTVYAPTTGSADGGAQ